MASIRSRYPRWPLAAAGFGLLAFVVVVALMIPVIGLPVTLRTGGPSGTSDGAIVGCYMSGTTGVLVSDPVNGTDIVSNEIGQPQLVAVIWPPGYTGRRALDGSVEVIDRHGNGVARTGTSVTLDGGFADGGFDACGDDLLQP
ncbi:MAG: hypothetical protein ACREMY_22300 [bacterium]